MQKNNQPKFSPMANRFENETKGILSNFKKVLIALMVFIALIVILMASEIYDGDITLSFFGFSIEAEGSLLASTLFILVISCVCGFFVFAYLLLAVFISAKVELHNNIYRTMNATEQIARQLSPESETIGTGDKIRNSAANAPQQADNNATNITNAYTVNSFDAANANNADNTTVANRTKDTARKQICPRCGTEQSITNYFCNHCGENIFDNNQRTPYWCKNCGQAGPYADVCPKCGCAEKWSY